MASSVENLIQRFQNGGMSQDELLAGIDHALAEDQTSSAQLASLLHEENTRFPLPPGVYEEVLQRIESRVATQYGGGYDSTGEATEVQTGHPGQPGRPGHPSQQSGPGNVTGPPPGETVTASPLPAGDDAARTDGTKGVGDTLNKRFVLEQCLGVGGMGTVYKALDLRKLEASDRKPYIAIKILNLQFRGHPQSLIALQREARKAQTLAHRNIVTVYDFDRDGPVVFLTMEYLSGKSLNRVLRAPDYKGMPIANALPVITGMGRALAYAHERGFVHCDFKPANVFLTDSGEVKVIDFGIARVFQRPAEDSDPTVFDPGTLGGLTPAYASPEMFEHREPDPRDDIFALACVSYEILTGRHPYERLSANQARAANIKPPRPAGLSRTQWRALREAMAFDRNARTPTVARFLEDMGVERRPTPPWLPATAGGLAVAVVAVGVWYLMWRAKTEPAPPEAPAVAQAPAPRAESTTPAAESPPPPARQAEEAPAKAPEPPSAPAIAPADAVKALVGGLQCSMLQAGTNGSSVFVQGYVTGRVGVDALRKQLAAIPGIRQVDLRVEPLADDKCGIVKLLAPYWSATRRGGMVSSIRTHTGDNQLVEGSKLVVDVVTPAQDSYVYVDYYVVDGNVAHLVPSKNVKGNQAPASYKATIGGGGNWIISKPFGTEMVVLVTTPVPLFDSPRPEFESRQAYLEAMERQLQQIAGKYGPGRITMDLVQITTRPK